MGEVLKKYGVGLEETGRLMVKSYERMTMKMPWIIRKGMSGFCKKHKAFEQNIHEKGC